MHVPPPVPAYSCQESRISCDLSGFGSAGLPSMHFPVFCSFPLEVTAVEKLWTSNQSFPPAQVPRSRWGEMWLTRIVLNPSVSIKSQKTHRAFGWMWQNEEKMLRRFSGSPLQLNLSGCSRADLNAQLKGLLH